MPGRLGTKGEARLGFGAARERKSQRSVQGCQRIDSRPVTAKNEGIAPCVWYRLFLRRETVRSLIARAATLRALETARSRASAERPGANGQMGCWCRAGAKSEAGI